MTSKTNKTRNLLHNHPMMKKGGVHQKSNKAQRKKEKMALRKAWFSPSAALSAVFGEDHAPMAAGNWFFTLPAAQY